MLVLVLSLVLLGFGMLAAGSVTGTVGWAWASVAVSVLAGMVLVADWRQKWRASRDDDLTGLLTGGGARITEPATIAFPPTTQRADPATEAILPLPPAWTSTSTQWAPQSQRPGHDNYIPGAVSPHRLDAGAGSDQAGTGAADSGSTPPTPAESVSPTLAGSASPTTGVADSGEKTGKVTVTPEVVRPGQSGGDPTQVLKPVQPTPEPGQERPDPALTAIVATLADKVLVVDEHPRYHLPGCRWLGGRETIALPATEAVELEFTPCQVCTPVQVLARTASTPVQAPGEPAEPPEQTQ